jgi:hypothetical protein
MILYTLQGTALAGHRIRHLVVLRASTGERITCLVGIAAASMQQPNQVQCMPVLKHRTRASIVYVYTDHPSVEPC